MSNEQKLREALRETLLFCETFSNRWDRETGAHPFGMVERARQALATTEPEPEPTGMPEIKPWDHPEPQTMRWSDLEIRWIQSYGEQCWKAGYKHGAWGDKPAVNQQLTTEPLDEREAFEKWLGIKPCGAAHDFGWAAWQARAAMAQVSDINVAESFTNDTKDAERYRWLADSNNYYEAINLISDGSLTEDALGKAIDAAMAKGVKG